MNITRQVMLIQEGREIELPGDLPQLCAAHCAEIVSIPIIARGAQWLGDKSRKEKAMSKVYFGFAIADSMFPETCIGQRRPISVEEVKALMEAGYISCCNPQHRATNEAAGVRYGLNIEVPERAPLVSLKAGDRVIVMSVRGLPR